MSETAAPTWTDAEHDEIMRLHIVDGLTIGEAMVVVFEKRAQAGDHPHAE